MANALIKKTGLYFVGNLASKCLSAVIVPIYALYVSASDLGDYDFLLTLSAVLYPVAFLAIWEAVLKFGMGCNASHRQGRITSNAIKASFPIAVVASMLLALLLALGGTPMEHCCLLVFMSMLTGAATIWQYCARSRQRTKDYIVSGIIGSVANFALIVTLVCIFHMGAVGLATSYGIGQLCIIVFLETKMHIFPDVAKNRLDRDLLKEMLRYCVPCVFNLLSFSLLTAVGRFAIIASAGNVANGQYAFAMKFAAIITAIGSIFSMAVIEEGILRAKQEKRDGLIAFYSDVSRNLLGLLLSLACLALPVILIFYLLIVGEEYSSSFVLIPLVISYAVVNVLSTYFGSAFMAVGKTSISMWSTIAGLAVASVLTFALVDYFGITGAAIGLLAGSTVITVLRAYLSIQEIRYRLRFASLSILGGMYIALSIVVMNLYSWESGPASVVLLLLVAAFSLPIAWKCFRGLSTVSDVEQ